MLNMGCWVALRLLKQMAQPPRGAVDRKISGLRNGKLTHRTGVEVCTSITLVYIPMFDYPLLIDQLINNYENQSCNH